MSWRNEPVTITRGRLVDAVLAGAFVVTTISILTALLAVEWVTEPPSWLFWAVFFAFAFMLLSSLFRGASYYIRRFRRRRRMRR